MKLKERIARTVVPQDQLAVFYLCQAGFCLKTSNGTLICIDAYFSDGCERMFGFKRMLRPVLAPADVEFDIVASTHAHMDHLDSDALDMLAKPAKTRFVGAADCRPVYESKGIPRQRFSILCQGDSTTLYGIQVRAIFADHGLQTPDAIGLLFTIGGINIYHTGDTAYRPAELRKSLNAPVDILIAPINKAFGNLDHVQAVELAAALKPKIVIASHFGMFLEHGGDPTAFLEQARSLPTPIKPLVMAPGETLLYSKTGEIELKTLPVDLE